MTTAISAELFKLRSTRAPWALGAVLTALVAAVVALNAALLGDAGQPAAVPAVLGDLVRFPGRLAGGVALLFGLMLTTGEYRHRTALTTRLVQPTASKQVLSKVVAAALAGAAVAGTIEVLVFAGGAALLASRDVAVQPLQHDIPAALGVIVAVAALHGAAGAGIGELLRNPALAIGLVLGWVFVAEGVVPVVLRDPGVSRWLPGASVQSALSVGLPHDHTALAPAIGLAMLVVYAAGLVLAGFARARLTDP
jgi:ABC-2 type transport system permease protein